MKANTKRAFLSAAPKVADNPLVDALKAVVGEAVREQIEKILGDLKPKPPKLLFTTEEAAEIISVPATWLAQAARQGKVPCVRVGHYVRFKLTDLEELAKSLSANQG